MRKIGEMEHFCKRLDDQLMIFVKWEFLQNQ
jgi:hypothetical protein